MRRRKNQINAAAPATEKMKDGTCGSATALFFIIDVTAAVQDRALVGATFEDGFGGASGGAVASHCFGGYASDVACGIAERTVTGAIIFAGNAPENIIKYAHIPLNPCLVSSL